MEANIEHAKGLFNSGEFAEAIPLLDHVMSTITSNSELHEMRAVCFLRTGEQMKGIEELRQSVHMISDNREGMLRVSVLMYEAGLAARSLEEIRKCLQLDQDDKQCRAHYRKVKALAKFIADAQTRSEEKDWDKCLASAKRFLDLEKDNREYALQANTLICRCGARVSVTIFCTSFNVCL